MRERGYCVSLTVVGKVADRKEFARIEQGQNTTCLPPQSKEELLKLYRKHDIFVMPSYTESFGLVYAEAMSQGLPVVYSAGQGFDAQFPEGQVGYRVDSHSPHDVAQAIERIIENYEEISSRVAMCAKKFQWDKIASCYDKIYQEM